MNKIEEVEKKLVREIDNLGGDVGLVVEYVESGERVEINAERQFWAASVIKVPIACTVFKMVEEGELSLSRKVSMVDENRVGGSGIAEIFDDSSLTVWNLIVLTLTVSDNSATNALIDEIGRNSVEEYMKELALARTEFRHKMMIKAGRGPNLTTASDMALLLKKLLKNEITGSEDILSIMKREQNRQRIQRSLPKGIDVAHKIGTLPNSLHDSGIIFDKEPIIFVFLSEDQEDRSKAAKVLARCAQTCLQSL